MFERFRWSLTSAERYSTGRLTPQKRGILCACQHFVSERVGVLAEYGGLVVRLPLGLRSLTLLRCLSQQFACALFVLDIADDGAKSVPDGQKQRQSCCKEDAQKARRATLAKVLGGVAWMELHAVLLLGLDTCAKPGFA